MSKNHDTDHDPFAKAQSGSSSQNSEFDASDFGNDTLFGFDETEDIDNEQETTPLSVEELTEITPHIHKRAQILVGNLDDSRGGIVAREVDSISHPGEYTAASDKEWSVVAGNIRRIQSGDTESTKRAIMQIHSRFGSIRQAIGRAKQASGEVSKIYDRSQDSITDKAIWNATVASILSDCIERLSPDVAEKFIQSTDQEYLVDALESIYTSSNTKKGTHDKRKFERKVNSILEL